MAKKKQVETPAVNPHDEDYDRWGYIPTKFQFLDTGSESRKKTRAKKSNSKS